jgi:hypothetical protein
MGVFSQVFVQLDSLQLRDAERVLLNDFVAHQQHFVEAALRLHLQVVDVGRRPVRTLTQGLPSLQQLARLGEPSLVALPLRCKLAECRPHVFICLETVFVGSLKPLQVDLAHIAQISVDGVRLLQVI